MAKTSTDVLYLMDQFKFREIRATRWLLWHSDFTKFDFGRGSAPIPAKEACDASPNPLVTRGYPRPLSRCVCVEMLK